MANHTPFEMSGIVADACSSVDLCPDMKKPLVSIVVVTYNSSKFVVETLESAYNQTYDGLLELIVSDDGSTDDTLAICQKWVAEHSDRFWKCQVIQTPSNLGICGNYNFALSHVSGEWIKYIAGDDILMPECIARYISESTSVADSVMICGTLLINQNGSILEERFLMEDHLDNIDAYSQAKTMAMIGHGIVEGPTLFLRTSLLKAMGGMDMKYPMLEDFPFVFKCAYNGHHIHAVKETLVKYRVYPGSVSQSQSAFHDMFYGCLYDARMKIAARYHDYPYWWHAWIQKRLLVQSKTFPHKIIRYLLMCSDIWMHGTRIKKLIKH